MKTANVKALNLGFGFSSVNAGQRSNVVEPQLIATSTDGGFRITPPVSRALGIAAGDNVEFFNNIDVIEAAIAQKNEKLVEFCNQLGIEFGTPEANIAIHKELDAWGICKGVLEKDAKGNVKTCTERLSKNDKLRFVSQHFDEMLTGAMEQADDDVKAALSREGITKDEQIDILTAFVTPHELPKYRGSKCANPAGLSGTNITLNFTDSNIWRQLKADLGENATSLNRVYEINLDEIQDIELNNGYETVTVKGVVLSSYVDKEPARIGKAAE